MSWLALVGARNGRRKSPDEMREEGKRERRGAAERRKDKKEVIKEQRVLWQELGKDGKSCG